MLLRFLLYRSLLNSSFLQYKQEFVMFIAYLILKENCSIPHSYTKETRSFPCSSKQVSGSQLPHFIKLFYHPKYIYFKYDCQLICTKLYFKYISNGTFNIITFILLIYIIIDTIQKNYIYVSILLKNIGVIYSFIPLIKNYSLTTLQIYMFIMICNF